MIVLLGVMFLSAVCFAFLVDAFLFVVAAALCNVEDVAFLKACGIVALERAVTLPFTAAAVLLVGVSFATNPELFQSLGALTGAQLAAMLVGAALFAWLVPLGYFRAIRLWVFRFLISLVVFGLAALAILAVLAFFQAAYPAA